jgi:hypothetical protein
MAKESRQISFKNAVICVEDNTITEYLKDETKVYDLKKVLSDWNGIEGINFTLKQEDDVVPNGKDD